ncbi:MAG: hypothetical protein AAF488_15755 [Planctomycetota bacterium]
MPDRTQLRSGSRIRILAVPQCDLDQRERERAEGLPDAGWTADTIERVIAEHPVVTVTSIDEYGSPWFEVELSGDDEPEEHSIMILDDDSWAHEPAPTK